MNKLASAGVLVLAAASCCAFAAAPDPLALGDRYWAEKKLDEAEKSYRSAIGTSPDNTRAYAKLAGLYLTSNRAGAAIPLYQQAITLDPENAKLFVGLSLAYLHQQEYSKANAMASRAQTLDPGLEQARKLLEYIALKKEVLAQADQAMAAEQRHAPAGQPAAHGQAPAR